MKQIAYDHKDRLGQAITVGAHVAFTWSANPGIRIGVITKITPKRVRMSFNHKYTRNGETVNYKCYHIARPEDCLVLSDTLQQELTLATLKKTI